MDVNLDPLSEKYSTKNLLFYRAIPPHVVPYSTDGYKLYGCIDCGDRFVFESSFNDHINRKSMKITYKCRHCTVSPQIVFYNRCNLLSHIRSHSFKTATINVSDLNIEPLPLNFYKSKNLKTYKPPISSVEVTKEKQASLVCCPECKNNITVSGTPFKDRAKHFMEVKYKNEVHSCPICLLTLPTVCALRAHLRIHLDIPPFNCPECGANLLKKCTTYPYNHNCEGFNMMRATARIKCPVSTCSLFHPNNFKQHLKSDHLKKVFKCPFCVVACFNESTICKHISTHEQYQLTKEQNVLIFFQCEMCPGRLVLQNHVTSHVKSHVKDFVYPCWSCGYQAHNQYVLLEHHINNHVENESLKMIYRINDTVKVNYRVVKKCDQCLRSFTYKCRYEDINTLPNACPYNCTPKQDKSKIFCPLCKNKICQDWNQIKKHFAEHHKDHKCVDMKLSISRVDLSKYKYTTVFNNKKNITAKKRISRKRVNKVTKEKTQKHYANNNTFLKPVTGLNCKKCDFVCDRKELMETHIRSHRDPCMEYQCLECGECFVVKPSFSTHLMMEHGISDIDDYIKEKQCYNESSSQQNFESDLPVDENQCKICREKFDNGDDLEKHFRVHGMAFLQKNALQNNVSA